ncbi:MAG TPA: DUF1028 domain-containing protein [Stellaceae bacterium]|nr:DUF1028 domain-containing protein [Stellaceae bacterium]
MTFSIAASCAATGMFGVAISSSSPAVAARCAHARAGVGAVATQNITDPSLGPALLDAMAAGAAAATALARIVATRSHIEYRQLIAVDRQGSTAHFSGTHTLGRHAVAEGEGAVAAGNLLANENVPAAMVAAFGEAPDDLGSRLVAALKAGLDQGGEAGPVHSAGLLLVDRVSWPVADLRVDWHEDDPIGALAALWDLYRPQMQAYVDRALDPAKAPSYGVPGDE